MAAAFWFGISAQTDNLLSEGKERGERMSSSRFREATENALIAWFPFVVIFLMLPISVYWDNRVDFDYDSKILFPFLVAALVSFLSVFALGLIGGRRNQEVAYGLFFLGVFLALSDIIVPLQWGLMDGSETLHISMRAVAIQAGLAVLLLAAWWHLPRPAVKSFGGALVLVILAWQGVALSRSIAGESTDDPSNRQVVKDAQIRKWPNVYQVVFDGYSGRLFLNTAAQVGLIPELQGFTFFENNMSNYVFTDASVPSFLTGQLFKGGSFKEFQLAARSGGLRRELHKAGYKISIYCPNRSRSWMYDDADYVYTSQDISRHDWSWLAQIVLVRAAPELLRRAAYRLSSKAFGGERASYGYYKRLSVPLMQKFLADEARRPAGGQYIYLHLILPHSPFVWGGSNCDLNARSSYSAQTACATRLMKDFVLKLKKLGRYENSLIILQSDHGWHEDDSAPFFAPPSQHVIEKIQSRQNYFEGTGFFQRISSLLLIKPQDSTTTPLRTSDQLTQLIDIQPTALGLLGLPHRPTDGHSVFELDEVGEREISVFGGLYNYDSAGKLRVLGRHTNHATFAHISYSIARGWTVHADVEATHEGW